MMVVFNCMMFCEGEQWNEFYFGRRKRTSRSVSRYTERGEDASVQKQPDEYGMSFPFM